jgi:aromatic ring-opening dioxygenase LigB subunit
VKGSAAWKTHWDSEEFCFERECDQELARDLCHFLNEERRSDDYQMSAPTLSQRNESELITSFSVAQSFPIAWGECVPLFFCKNLDESVKLVIISWPRARLQPKNYSSVACSIGIKLHRFIQSEKKRIAIIFSCDMSHAHGNNADYPPIFNCDPPLYTNPPLAAEFDGLIVKWIQYLVQGNIEESNNILLQSAEMAEAAMACGWAGFWALQGFISIYIKQDENRMNKGLILDGDAFCQVSNDSMPLFSAVENRSENQIKTEERSYDGAFHFYAAPTYYGMMVASIYPRLT